MGSSVPPVNVAFTATGVPAVTRTFVELNGRMSSFGRQSFTAINATGFALSSLASGGQVSFRSLTASATGFLSFFGAGGVMAAGFLSTGLIITDFFTRTRREIEETKQKARAAAKELRDDVEQQRRGGDQTALINRVQQATQNLAESEQELADVRAKLLPIDQKLEQVRKLSSVAAALLKRNEEEGTKALRERRAELEATVPLLRQEIDLARQAALNVRSQTGTRTTPITVTVKEAEDRADAIQKEIAALATISQTRRLSGAEVVRLVALERTLTAELRAGQVTKEREAEIWQQITRAREAAARAIPAVQVRDLLPTVERTGLGQQPLPGRGRSATNLPQPNIPPATAAEKAAIQARLQAAFDAQEMQDLQEAFAASFASVIAGGITQGFAMGLADGGIAGGFRQMAAQMLTGFGSILTQIGAKALEAALLSNTFFSSLLTNPVAAIGAAVALTVLGTALGGRGGGGFRGSTGFAGTGANTIPIDIQRLIVDPNVRNAGQPMKVVSLNVLGAKTAQGSVLIGEGMKVYQGRGG